MATQVSQAVARPVRTAVQAVPSFVVTEFVDAFIYNLNDKQYAALAAFLLLLFGYLQVVIEDKNGVALFRRIIPGDVPVVNVVSEAAVEADKSDDDKAIVQTAAPVVINREAEKHFNDGIENQAYDEIAESPDTMVGESVEAEHDLDISIFEEK